MGGTPLPTGGGRYEYSSDYAITHRLGRQCTGLSMRVPAPFEAASTMASTAIRAIDCLRLSTLGSRDDGVGGAACWSSVREFEQGRLTVGWWLILDPHFHTPQSLTGGRPRRSREDGVRDTHGHGRTA